MSATPTTPAPLSRAGHRARASAAEDGERRARVKAAAVDLAAHLRAHGARTSLGKLTPRRGTVAVRQDARPRVLVEVRVTDDGTPLYSVPAPGAGARGDDVMTAVDVVSVRRAVLAPRRPWGSIGVAVLVVVAWVLAGSAVAVLTDEVHWATLGALVGAGTVVTLLVALVASRARLRRRERRARELLGGRGRR
ncbi:hypothetical protein JN535_20010 [Cellulosimicrobium cellulans]|uniref:hypothetical protein n=1 Tax=Cellulosimicrobium cellulans TaxID=1710 RepID=UPI0019655E21|nr:hypothetical protein [Cellulosimicrobium cellulans]MBN0042438.1 hypothetical protein [Cellulosimicrobium cellulans]